MDKADQILVAALVCGSVLAGGVGALAGAGLRPEVRFGGASSEVVVPTQEVFMDGAPAYPSFAPEPLYPEARAEEFAEAWDEAMRDAPPGPRPAAFEPPEDLPPAYEVRMESDAKPASAPPLEPAREPFY